MDRTINSAHWYPDCASFWLRADEARSRDAVTAALRRYVELVVLPKRGFVRRVEVAPPESWGGAASAAWTCTTARARGVRP